MDCGTTGAAGATQLVEDGYRFIGSGQQPEGSGPFTEQWISPVAFPTLHSALDIRHLTLDTFVLSNR